MPRFCLPWRSKKSGITIRVMMMGWWLRISQKNKVAHGCTTVDKWFFTFCNLQNASNCHLGVLHTTFQIPYLGCVWIFLIASAPWVVYRVNLLAILHSWTNHISHNYIAGCIPTCCWLYLRNLPHDIRNLRLLYPPVTYNFLESPPFRGGWGWVGGEKAEIFQKGGCPPPHT